MTLTDKLNSQPQKIKYSQNGEEYYLKTIFDSLGTTNKHLVDVGAWDGSHLSNTKIFREENWSGLLIDGKEFPGIEKHFIDKDNILSILKKYNTPQEFDLLSIDIDGNDFWVLDEILSRYSPRVIISEYNSEHDPNESKSIEHDPKFTFGNNDYYGYTFKAGLRLADWHGYTVIFQNSYLNMYYVKKELVPELKHIEIPKQHPWWGNHSDKKWIDI